MTIRVQRLRMVAVGLALVTLSGCSHTVESDPPPPARTQSEWPGCVMVGAFAGVGIEYDPSAMGSIPADFVPTTAVLCEQDDATGEELERRTTAIAPLLTYLARPSREARNPTSLACPAMAWFRPWLFLEDADGRWIYPQVPTSACGFALDQFEDEDSGPVYRRLPYTDTVVG